MGRSPPRLVPKGSRRLGGLDDIIISLYAGRMTLRDIQHHLASTIGTDLSHETISKICDEVLDAVDEWQNRPLEPLYPVIYLDALVVKVKDGSHVRNKHAHIAIGVDMGGGQACAGNLDTGRRRRQVLGRGCVRIWPIAASRTC